MSTVKQMKYERFCDEFEIHLSKNVCYLKIKHFHITYVSVSYFYTV